MNVMISSEIFFLVCLLLVAPVYIEGEVRKVVDASCMERKKLGSFNSEKKNRNFKGF